MLKRLLLAACLGAAVVTAAGLGQAAVGPGAHCARGTKPATLAGKHVCLRAGQRCTRRLDARYHRFGFHCHGARLTVRKPPAPVVMTPPKLADPPARAGRLVDIGGYRLWIECVGSGSPTVVIEPGASAHAVDGVRGLQHAVAATTRVCVYDRADLPSGESDARPPGVAPTAQRFSLELRTLLANAGEQGPFVLVGASFAGALLTSFTLRYPGDVAGLVFLDAVAPSEDIKRVNGVYAAPEPWDGGADLNALEALTFGSRPVAVLEATLAADAADLARRSSARLHARVPTSHFILLDAPYFGLEATRLVVAAARAGAALPRCAQTQLVRYGAGCL